MLPKRGVRRSDIEREVAVMQAVSHPKLGGGCLVTQFLEQRGLCTGHVFCTCWLFVVSESLRLQECDAALQLLGGFSEYLPGAPWRWSLEFRTWRMRVRARAKNCLQVDLLEHLMPPSEG